MRILIIDDNKLSRMSIRSGLDKTYKVVEADNFEDAKKLLNDAPFDLCFIDLNLDDDNDLKGLDLISIAGKNGVYPVVMSAYEADDIVNQAYDLGCKDFYAKGNEETNVNETIRRFYDSKESFTRDLVSEIFPTKNPAQKKIIQDMAPIIPTTIPVYIKGDTGSGKTFLAGGIHKISKRPGAFISLNCGGISEELMEAELFGHSKGAFTGANDSKSGKLLLAHKGTLFLDEIGSMPMSMQIKLLKALDDGKFYPVNSDKLVYSDFRLICAGLDNLLDLVQKGIFRRDLFQRLSGYSISLMPLRERPEDIMPTIRQTISSTRRIVFSAEAKEAVHKYGWPGNIRQLIHFSNVLSRISTGVVTEEQVKASIYESSSELVSSSLVSDSHIELIKKVGLQDFLNIIRDEAIKLGLQKNGGKGRSLISDFKMSSATLHRYMKGRELTHEIQ